MLSTVNSDEIRASLSRDEIRHCEKEMQRARGKLSCVECRRMKIKCDRKVPCSSCVKRRCEDRCPNGSTTSPETEIRRLRNELDKAKERIEDLEKALKLAHAMVSDSVHPLLSDAQMSSGSLDIPNSSPDFPELSDPSQDITEIFGTLSIGDRGESVFLGPSAVTESLMLSESQPRTINDVFPDVPPVLSELLVLWPFARASTPEDELRTSIELQLPSLERASALCEAYLQNLSWINLSVSRAQLMEELLPLIYHRKTRPDGTAANVHSRDLALFFAVLACGAAGDLTQKADNNEGSQYYYLSRAAMGLGCGACRGCMQGLLTITLLGLYHLFANPADNSAEEAWRLHSVATSSASSLGLHRDPGRWNLSPQMQDQRRRVFWGLCLLEYFRAFTNGRPPLIIMDAADVEYPQDAKISSAVDGIPFNGYFYWTLQFLQRCLAPVVQRFCANPRPVKFSEVMEYDGKIREYEAEKAKCLHQEGSSHPLDTSDSVCVVKHLFMFQDSDILMLGIHRNFFARAVLDYPHDPLQSPFAPSFLTALRLAITTIQKLQEAVDLNLPLVLRIWSVWSHSLNSAVIVGSVASRCPTSNFAISAYTALESAIRSFDKASEHPIASRGLPILSRLREKALRAVSNPQGVDVSTPESSDEDNDIELNILRGALRLVSHKASVTDERSLVTVSSELPHVTEPYVRKYGTHGSHESTYESIPSINQNDWVVDIDAVMARLQQHDYSTLPFAGLAAEAGSFASLEPDAFLPFTTDMGTHHSQLPDITFDQWDAYSSNNALEDLPFF